MLYAFGDYTLDAVTPPASTPAQIAVEWRQLTVLACQLVYDTAPAAPGRRGAAGGAAGLSPALRRRATPLWRGAAAVSRAGPGRVFWLPAGAGRCGPARGVRRHSASSRRSPRSPRQVQRDWGVALAVQVGMHTGREVVGSMALGDRGAPLALGDTQTLATALRDSAPPDTVLLSQATFRLVQRDVVCAALGTHLLEAGADPLGVYQVLRARAPQPPWKCNRLVAQHYTAAGCTGRRDYWRGRPAGQRPLGPRGSRQPLTTGMTSEEPGRTPEHTQQACPAIALGAACDDQRASARGRARHTQARALCQQVGETPGFPVLLGLWRYALVRLQLQPHENSGTRCAPGATCRHPLTSSPTSLGGRGSPLARSRCAPAPGGSHRPLHAQTSAVHGCSGLGQDPGVVCRGFCRCDPLVAGVPGASPGPRPRGSGVGPGAGASL